MQLILVIIIGTVPSISWSQFENSKMHCTLYTATHGDSLTDYIKLIEKDGKIQGGFYYGEGLQVDRKRFYYFSELSIFEGSQQEVSLESGNTEFGRWPGKNSTMRIQNEKIDKNKLPWQYEHPIRYLGKREGSFLRLTIASQKHLFGLTEKLDFQKLSVECSVKPQLDF